MRKRVAAAVLVSVLLAIAVSDIRAEVQVTVLDFEGPEASWRSRGIALLFERELLARDGLTVLDRRHLHAILAEAGLAELGLLTPEARRALPVGSLDLAVTGTWKLDGTGRMLVTAVVLDASTGLTVAHAADQGDPAKLDTIVARITARIAESLSSRAPGIAAPPRFALPPVGIEELTALTRAAEAEISGDYPSAHLHLRRGIAGNPESDALRLELGRLLLRMGEPLHAALSFRVVAGRGGPYFASRALALLARVCEHDLGRPAIAARCYRELTRRYPHVRDAERYRMRQVELLDRADRRPDAYLALLDYREQILARLRNLDRKTRWFGGPYQRLAGIVNGLDLQLARRYVSLPDVERAGLPRPARVHLVEEDGAELRILPEDLGKGDISGSAAFWLIAPEGRSLVRAEIEIETGPGRGTPPVTVPKDRTGVRIATGYQVLLFGAGHAPRARETRTLVFDEPDRMQHLSIDTLFRWRRLYELRVRLVTARAPETNGPTSLPPPPNCETLLDGIAGGPGWVDAAWADGEMVVVFSDVARYLGAGPATYPWPPGGDADLHLVRRGPEGSIEATRLPLSSERDDLFPALARHPSGAWRLVWLSNRRDGYHLEVFTSTSKDLEHWTWPRLVETGIRARPTIGRDIYHYNLGQVFPVTAPHLHCDQSGVWTLLYYSTWGPEGHGVYLAQSDDGETYGPPVLLTQARLTSARIMGAPGGGVLAFWMDREDDPDAGTVRHVLRRYRVVGGEVRERETVPLGATMRRNPWSRLVQPWATAEGSACGGWVRGRDPESEGEKCAPRPSFAHLFRVSSPGEAQTLGAPIVAPGSGEMPRTLPTPRGLALIYLRTRHHGQRATSGELTVQWVDVPGLPSPAVPRTPVRLEPGGTERDDGILAVAVLPVEVEGKGAGPALADAATSLVLEGLAGAPGVRLVERERVGRILEELAFEERSGAAGRVRIGRMLGADLVVAGDVLAEADRARAVLTAIDVESSAVRHRARWEGSRRDLLARLTILGAQFAPALRLAPESNVERFEKDSESRLAFVRGVSDVLAGLGDRAAGEFLEALRLGLDYPPTRYWLARALESLGEEGGAALEYRHYLDEQEAGVFASEAREAFDRLRSTIPRDAGWVPRADPAAPESDLLKRVYRGRTMDERVTALRAYAAGPGRGRLDRLLEIFDLEADAWFRFQVLEVLLDLDRRTMLRAAARGMRSGWSVQNELQNFFRAIPRQPWVGEYVLECLEGEETEARKELWEGLTIVQRYPGPLSVTERVEVGRAVAEAVKSRDPPRFRRAFEVLGWYPDLSVEFDQAARIFFDRTLAADVRKMAAQAMARADLERTVKRVRPLLAEGVDCGVLLEALPFLPSRLDTDTLWFLLLDPEIERGPFWSLLDQARESFPERIEKLALEMLESDRPSMRGRGISILRGQKEPPRARARAGLIRISRRDPDPKLREGALSTRCRHARLRDAEGLLEEIAGLPETHMQSSVLHTLASKLAFRPPPAAKEGLEAWRRWLAFSTAERKRTGPLIEELDRAPPAKRVVEIADALAGSRDPEAARAIVRWLGRSRRAPEEPAPRETLDAARDALGRLLLRLGFPKDSLPPEGAEISRWIIDNDPGHFRPWMR